MSTLKKLKALAKLYKVASAETNPKTAAKLRNEFETKRAKLQERRR